MKNTKGEIIFIPVPLGDNDPKEVLPQKVIDTINELDEFIVENEKTARRFIKKICPTKDISSIKFNLLNKRTEDIDHSTLIQSAVEGKTIGLMSEAGTPGIADPGAEIAALAHQKGIRITPLVGPSSILLAMMASGLNGQSFAFNGYLPIDKNERKKSIKDLERTSVTKDQTQIFIETPYRNDKLMEELTSTLSPNTMLCIASNITTSNEFIKTMPIKEWSNNKIKLHKTPAIFLFHKK
ncbi:MAG: SAM-dependent methyltransferase [Ichthyobacteriaceae bacterium]|nr:SAM-dependent methyltransferase [Ichthyobacteriaceae bacterium]